MTRSVCIITNRTMYLRHAQTAHCKSLNEDTFQFTATQRMRIKVMIVP